MTGPPPHPLAANGVANVVLAKGASKANSSEDLLKSLHFSKFRTHCTRTIPGAKIQHFSKVENGYKMKTRKGTHNLDI